MMEKEKQDYLDRLYKRINVDSDNIERNIIIVFKLDDYVKKFLKGAGWIKGNYFYFYGLNDWYRVVPIEEFSRGFKPRKIIVDSRIPFKDLWSTIEPRLIHCIEFHYF